MRFLKSPQTLSLTLCEYVLDKNLCLQTTLVQIVLNWCPCVLLCIVHCLWCKRVFTSRVALLGMSSFPYLAQLMGGLTKSLISKHWLTKTSLSGLSKVVGPNFMWLHEVFFWQKLKSLDNWSILLSVNQLWLQILCWKIKREWKQIAAIKKASDKSSLIVGYNWNHSGGKKEISLKKQSLAIVCVRIIAVLDDRDHCTMCQAQ